MMISLLTHDFSVLYVAENNATTTPPFISAISLWAALEGSILFWAFLATGWASLVLWRHRDRHRLLMPWVGATLASVNLFFFAVMTWPGNPFVAHGPGGAPGAGAERAAPEPPVHGAPPAAALPRLHRAGGAVRLRDGGARHAAAGRGVAADRAALDDRAVDLPHPGHRGRGVVELRGARLGRLLGLGPGRERGAAPLADGHRLRALGDGRRATRRPAHLDQRARHRHVRADPGRHVPDALGDRGQRPLASPSRRSGRGSWAGSWWPWRSRSRLLVWRLPELSGGGRPSAPVSRESAFLLNNVLFLGITFAVLFGTLLPLHRDRHQRRHDQRRRALVQRGHRPDVRRAPVPDGRRPGAAVGHRVVGDAARAFHRAADRRRRWWSPRRCSSGCEARGRSAPWGWPSSSARSCSTRSARRPRPGPRTRRGPGDGHLAAGDAQPATLRRLRRPSRRPRHGRRRGRLVRAWPSIAR